MKNENRGKYEIISEIAKVFLGQKSIPLAYSLYSFAPNWVETLQRKIKFQILINLADCWDNLQSFD